LCWYNRDGVVIVLDNDGDRLDQITMSLEMSPSLKKLATLEQSRKAFSQKEAIHFLRIDFRDAGLGSLPDMLKNVKFTVNTEGDSSVDRTRISVGKSTLAAFHGFENLPSEVAFRVPVFTAKFEIVEPIMVAIEPDPTTQSFQFIPFAGQIEAALQRAEVALGAALAKALGEAVPVILGKP
jgi:hypothetical protein